jgi:hypothetical protein
MATTIWPKASGSATEAGLAPAVLYIGGSGRSGSTLLDRMLGQLPGLWSTGELVRLWDLGLRDNQLCGCGSPFRSCPFWTLVGERAFGGWSNLDLPSVLRLHSRVRRHRYLPLMATKVGSRLRREVEQFTSLLVPLYRAVAATSRRPVIVDSSKEPAYGWLLGQALGPNVRMVHLVRDCRGVAFSWTKKVTMPDQPNRELPRYGPAHMALRWLFFNLIFEAVRAGSTRQLFVRYEDLVDHPHREMARILDLVSDIALPVGPTTQPGPNHTVAGNPLRFREEPIALRRDEAWRTNLPRHHRLLVSALSAPSLARYGYPIRPTSPGQEVRT